MERILIRRPKTADLDRMGIDRWGDWSCEATTFDWDYDEPETCYLFEGQVEVTTPLETVEFGAGDLVVFPAGLRCTWKVAVPVRKKYRFG